MDCNECHYASDKGWNGLKKIEIEIKIENQKDSNFFLFYFLKKKKKCIVFIYLFIIFFFLKKKVYLIYLI